MSGPASSAGLAELRTVAALRAWRRAQGATRVAVVPTMGALHAGHRALIREARARAERVVVTLFVNPTQFGAGEDLSAYPRPYEADRAACTEEGADALFAPSAEEVYAPGFQTWVQVEEATRGLCGDARPTHFRGVATVVAMLFNLVQPDLAFFGKKDYQQWVVIRRMVQDLHMPVEVVGVETVREPDGLAMSSRNVYLGAPERQRASALSRGLRAAQTAYRAGERDPDRLRATAAQVLVDAGVEAEYLEIREAGTLAPWTQERRPVLLVAARVGRARLIDNLEL